MKTKEQILKPYKSEMYDCNMDECYGYYESEVLKAMEEYASQFKTKPCVRCGKHPAQSPQIICKECYSYFENQYKESEVKC